MEQENYLNCNHFSEPDYWQFRATVKSLCWLSFYRGTDKSLARPNFRYILFDGENISFDAILLYIYIYIYIYIYSTNIPPIMIINRIYEIQIFCRCSLFLPGRAKDLSAPRGTDKSLAQPTSRCILFDGENNSFDACLVLYVNSTNIPTIMIVNRIYETQIICRCSLFPSWWG